MSDGSVVYLIGGEPETRQRCTSALAAAGFAVKPSDDLSDLNPDVLYAGPSCLLLDGAASSPNETASALEQFGDRLPLLVLLGEPDVGSAVAWMRHGAADVLAPPYDETALAARVRDVLERDGEGVVRRQRRRAILSRMASLTRREREVMNHVVAGRSNKQVADAMGVSIKTVEVHRSRVMRKMDAGSLAGLVQQYLFVSRGNGNGDHSDPPRD